MNGGADLLYAALISWKVNLWFGLAGVVHGVVCVGTKVGGANAAG